MSRFTSPDFLRQAGTRREHANPPPVVDLARPSLARLHSFHLKGKDHFEVDRDLALEAEQVAPGFQDLVMGERAFLQRAVRHLSEDLGIDQFVQLGAGLPAPGDPHEIAPAAKVVYVTDDLMVLAHHRALVRDDRTIAVEGHLTRPHALSTDPAIGGFLDPDRPVGLLLAGTLSHVGTVDNPTEHLTALRGLLPAGSHAVVSHYHRPESAVYPKDANRAEQLQRVFRTRLNSGYWRSREEILALLADWEVLSPGLIEVQRWRTLPVAPPVPGSYQMPQRNRRLLVGALARV
ncbi:SAM-dependent methyltransferase [Nocardiopsis sp. N85]|uniref:SAM-dependent methyltransferase n=1 Tax=Nocardiopsis sp. N85 TaxID=3029400 RepID=UPI00237F59BC|nr:SAM-dependent methyltransferase [Nocardiopsis sp. N85]MDE3720143.1 SAM-dependent methyltransferase [Nocardiopsis sp. N85]